MRKDGMLEGNAFSERTNFTWIDWAILLKKFTTLIFTIMEVL